MNWKENADEIKRLKDEYNEANKAYFAVWDPKTEEEKSLYNLNRQRVFQAKDSLEQAIQNAVAQRVGSYIWLKFGMRIGMKIGIKTTTLKRYLKDFYPTSYPHGKTSEKIFIVMMKLLNLLRNI